MGSVPEIQVALGRHPGCRLLGGGTVLAGQIAREGWTGDLLTLAGCPEARAIGPRTAGAAVTLDELAGAAGAVPAHLAAAAARAGSAEVRRAATVGGNCAPDVAGCVYLVLLSLAAEARTATPDLIVDRPLWTAGEAALVGVRWSGGATGGFARTAEVAGNGLPVCAVAVTAVGAALRIAVGYLTPRPVVVTTTEPESVPHAVVAGGPGGAREAVDDCLRRALRSVG